MESSVDCIVQERLSESEDRSVETSQTEMQKENNRKKHNRTFKNWDHLKKCNMGVIRIPEEKEDSKRKF